ncbi:MAG: hypothetical protein Tsb0016_18470 [Sphingomonadales bacterium]
MTKRADSALFSTFREMPINGKTSLRRLRFDGGEGGGDFAFAVEQVMIGLKAEEEDFRDAEITCQAQIGVSGDGALAKHDFIDPPWRHGDSAGQRVLELR